MKKPSNFIETKNNTIFDFENTDYTTIDLDNLLHVLNRNGRFNYQTNRLYSVLEHSLLCLRVYIEATNKSAFSFSPHTALRVFTHDFHEAIIGDILGPVRKQLAKNCPEVINSFSELEEYIERAIYLELFNSEKIYFSQEEIVYEIDMHALHVEHCKFFGNSKYPWSYPISSRLVNCVPPDSVNLPIWKKDNDWIPDPILESVSKDIISIFQTIDFNSPNEQFMYQNKQAVFQLTEELNKLSKSNKPKE